MSKGGIAGFVTAAGILPAAVTAFVLIFPGCTVFRKVSGIKHIFQKKTEQQAVVTSGAKTEKSIEMRYADSAKSSFRVTIVPEGAFRYSPDSGFRGKAKALFIRDDKSTWKSALVTDKEKEEVKIDSSGRSRKRQSEQMSIKDKLVKTNSLHFKILALLSLVLAGGLLLKKIRGMKI